jgi:hypothetical protein
LKGHHREREGNRSPPGVLDGQCKAGKQPDDRGLTAFLQKHEEGEGDGGERDVVIGAGRVAADHRSGGDQQRGGCARVPVDLPDQRGEEREMDQGGGGMASEGECEQVEHLHSAGHGGVEIVGDAHEAMFAEVAHDQAEVIAGAIGTGLGRKRVAEVENAVGGKGERPQRRLGPGKSRPLPEEDRRAACEHQPRVGQVQRAEREHDRTEGGRADDEARSRVGVALQPLAQRETHRRGETCRCQDAECFH